MSFYGLNAYVCFYDNIIKMRLRILKMDCKRKSNLFYSFEKILYFPAYLNLNKIFIPKANKYFFLHFTNSLQVPSHMKTSFVQQN